VGGRKPALASLLQHLIGTVEETRRDREPEPLGGLEVDYQLENGWLLGQIYPDLASTKLSSDQSFYTDNNSKTIQANWSSGSTQGSTASTASNFSFDLSDTLLQRSI
jgi:hypothetical protein